MSEPAALAEAVYPPREDTELLRPFADGTAGLLVLEVGTGSGVVAERAADAGGRVVATDLNRAALARLRRRPPTTGGSLAVVRADLLDGLRRFDRILFNPPYLPTSPGMEDPDPSTDRALNGGADGWSVAARFLDQLPDHLRPGGRAYLLVSTLQDPARGARLQAEWRARGGSVTTVAERPLEGERLLVWELRAGPTERAARRTGRPPAGTGARRRTRRRPRSGSSPATAPGRSRARGGASGRRRSPPGS